MIVLTTLGAIIGFIGGAIVLFDRYYKGRPIASLSTMDDDGKKRVCIRVKNTTAYDIAVLGLKVEPPLYYLTEHLDTLGAIRGAKRESPKFLLEPEETRHLIIAPRIEHGVALEVKTPGRVTFKVIWRSGNSTWVWRRAVPVCTHTETVRLFGLTDQNDF